MEVDNNLIIIIEDDEDDQFLIRKIFEKLDSRLELLFFDNGKEALRHLKSSEQSIFLILCDINMPIMNGFELRDNINRDEALRRRSIPFIFFSTSARPADVVRAYELTVQGFFIKENNLTDFEETLRLILSYWRKCKHPIL